MEEARRYRVIEELLCIVCRRAQAQIVRRGQRAICSERCRIRAMNMRRLYRLSPEQFWEMWDNQRGKCAMPGCTTALWLDFDSGRRQQGVQIDHSPRSGAVRALLCPRCNFCLSGYEILRELGAAEYLSGFGE